MSEFETVHVPDDDPRHWETGPSIIVGEAVDYPEPKAGKATSITLTTPDGAPVGTLIYNDTGLHWTPADTEDISAQEHAAEVLTYIRGHREEDIALEDTIAGIREAYVGDYNESSVRFVPGKAS